MRPPLRLRTVGLLTLATLVCASSVDFPEGSRRLHAQNQTDKQTCEDAKKEITELQDLIAQESASLGRLEMEAEGLSEGINRALQLANKFFNEHSDISV